jgi:hypothetical protein
MNVQPSGNVSIPPATRAPRPLTDAERRTLARVADTLVPARDATPAASGEPGFWDQLAVALDARADAFDGIAVALAGLATTEVDELWDRLQALDLEEPVTFQALSAVIAGAWLMTSGTRDRIGYHGQQSDKAGIEEAADEISSGVLDPVLERDPEEGPRWIR